MERKMGLFILNGALSVLYLFGFTLTVNKIVLSSGMVLRPSVRDLIYGNALFTVSVIILLLLSILLIALWDKSFDYDPFSEKMILYSGLYMLVMSSIIFYRATANLNSDPTQRTTYGFAVFYLLAITIAQIVFYMNRDKLRSK